MSKKEFSSTVIEISSLVGKRFPEMNMLMLKKLQPKFGHNSKTKRVSAYFNLVQTNDQILLSVLENIFFIIGLPWQAIPVK